LARLIEKAPEIIQALVEALIENLPLLIDAAIEIILALASAILENLPLLLESAGKIIEEIVKGIGMVHEKLREAVLGIFNRLKEFFLETDWGQLGRNIINALKNAIVSVASGLGNFVSSLFSFGGAQTQSIPIAFEPSPRNADNFAFAGIETLGTIAPRVGLSRASTEQGAAAMIGMEQGMRNNAHRPIEAAMEIARQVAAIMQRALGVASPSKVTARIGRFAAEGLALEMIQSAPLVEAAAVKLGLAAAPKTDQRGGIQQCQTHPARAFRKRPATFTSPTT
jgi:hypothetical protein